MMIILHTQASEKASPARVGSATVTIAIGPATNDHTPAFAPPAPSATPVRWAVDTAGLLTLLDC